MKFQVIRNVRIKYRLIILYALLSLLMLAVIGFFSYYKSNQAIHTKISTYSSQIMNQISKNLESEMERLNSTNKEVINSSIIQDSLTISSKMDDGEIFQLKKQMDELLLQKYQILNSVKNTERVV